MCRPTSIRLVLEDRRKSMSSQDADAAVSSDNHHAPLPPLQSLSTGERIGSPPATTTRLLQQLSAALEHGQQSFTAITLALAEALLSASATSSSSSPASTFSASPSNWKTAYLLLRFSLISLPMVIKDVFFVFASVTVLLPAIIRGLYYYTTSSDRVSVSYAHESCRQTVDVYRALHHGQRKGPGEPLAPVVVFFPGGAWIIGYKMFSCYLARSLAHAGVTVVVGDYRNFPFGFVPDQMKDVERAIQWTLDHAAEYGGDPTQVTVVGESAGGHLACTVLLRKALEAKLGVPRTGLTPFRATDIKGYISTAAPYDIDRMEPSFAQHGMEGYFIDYLFCGERSLHDPFRIVQECNKVGLSLKGFFPPVKMFQGDLDETVPHHLSVAFAEELAQTCVPIEFVTYVGNGHTRAAIEGMMDGDHTFPQDICEALNEWSGNKVNVRVPIESPIMQRTCPSILVAWGAYLFPL